MYKNIYIWLEVKDHEISFLCLILALLWNKLFQGDVETMSIQSRKQMDPGQF